MMSMQSFWLILFVMWSVRSGVHDVLETQDYIGGPWRIVPGPYPVVGGEYKVPIPNQPQAFFRVTANWGVPWVR
jgi:hypothetical protein